MAADLDPSLVRTFRGHRGPVTSIDFAPDLRYLASGSADKCIMLWNLEPKLRAFRFVGHTAAVTDVAFSPTGALVASASQDKTVRLWQANVRGDHVCLKGHSARVRSVDFAWDGKTLLSCSDDKTVKLWSLPSRRFQRSLIGHSNWVRDAAFSPDARLVVSGGDDKTVRLWDAAEGAQLATFYEHSDIIHTARFGPDGTCVAAAAQDGSVNLWDVRSHRLIQHYDAHAGPVTSMRFHPSGSFLYTASEDGTSKVWDLREGHLLYTIEGHGAVRALGSTVGGAHFATGGDDSLVMVWNARFAKQFPAVGRATAAAEAREKELFSSPGEGAETGKGRSRRGRAGQKASATRPTSRPRSGSRTGPSKEQGALAVGEGDTMDYLPGGDISSRGSPGVSRKSPPPAHELRGDAPVVPAPAAREVAQEPSRERSEGAGASSVRARDSEGTVAKDAAVMMMERLMEQMETLTQTVSLLDSRLANQEDRVEELATRQRRLEEGAGQR